MSATRAIFFGAALGFTAGAAALAEDLFGSNNTILGAGVGTELNTEDGAQFSGGAVMDAETGTNNGHAMGSTVVTGETSITLSADELIGARVYDENQEWIGEVSKVMPANGLVQERVVIDFGGFLGIGETPIEIDAEDISISWTDSGEVDHAVVAKSEAELELMAKSQS